MAMHIGLLRHFAYVRAEQDIVLIKKSATRQLLRVYNWTADQNRFSKVKIVCYAVGSFAASTVFSVSF